MMQCISVVKYLSARGTNGDQTKAKVNNQERQRTGQGEDGGQHILIKLTQYVALCVTI